MLGTVEMRLSVRACIAVMLTHGIALAEPSALRPSAKLDIDRVALATTLRSLEAERQYSTLLAVGTLDAVAQAQARAREGARDNTKPRFTPSLRFARGGVRAVFVALF